MKIVMLIIPLILFGCADINGLANSINSGLNSAMGIPETYTAPILAVPPRSMGLNDEKSKRLDEIEAKGFDMAKSGKITWLKYVSIFYDERARLYPDSDDSGGTSELIAYQKVIAEQVDNKQLTSSQALYLLEKKSGELSARNQLVNNSRQQSQTTRCTTTSVGTTQFPESRTTCY